MSDEVDVWSCLRDAIDAPTADYSKPIISFINGTADVRLDPSTWG